MSYWLVYHSFAQNKYLPGYTHELDWDHKEKSLGDFTLAPELDVCRFWTGKKQVYNAIGDVVFLVVGIKELRQSETSYYLWNWMVLEEVELNVSKYVGTTQQWGRFSPPVLLEGQDFAKFKKGLANFGQGFSKISSSDYCGHLVELYERANGIEMAGPTREERFRAKMKEKGFLVIKKDLHLDKCDYLCADKNQIENVNKQIRVVFSNEQGGLDSERSKAVQANPSLKVAKFDGNAVELVSGTSLI